MLYPEGTFVDDVIVHRLGEDDFLLVINALMLKLAAWFVPGFAVRGFWPALLGGAILSVLSLVVRRLLHQ